MRMRDASATRRYLLSILIMAWAGMFASVPARAEPTAPAGGTTLYVRAGRLIDPERGTVETARLLRVENGRVVAITADTGAPLPAGAAVVDWSGYSVLPGLIDMHVHLADADQTNNPAEPLLHSAMEIAYLGARNARTTLAQREGFRKAVKAGVKLAFGTDAGIFPHGLNARQFRYMVQWGMTPMQAIQSATVVGAEMLGWSRDVGALSPGHYADMIAVAGDPLADITVLEQVAHVMKGGTAVR